MRHAPKRALVIFENRPNFVRTLLKLWGNDSEHFWRFLDIFWENHLPVSKWCHRCHGSMVVTAAPKSPHMFIFIISNYWKSFGTDICQKSTMSHALPLLSHCLIVMGHALKMALVTFENRPNFVWTLLELWGNDSDNFWKFLDNFWENHLPVSKWCHGCHAGHSHSKIATYVHFHNI